MEKLAWGGVGVWGRLDIFTLSPNEPLSMASLHLSVFKSEVIRHTFIFF